MRDNEESIGISAREQTCAGSITNEACYSGTGFLSGDEVGTVLTVEQGAS